QVDAGPFVQDDWKVKPNLTLSLGLRYEIQTNAGGGTDWAPRIGLAWGIGSGQKAPKTVLRLGAGIFYNRIDQSLTLQAERQNGITQQYYVVSNPDFFPDAPPLSQLAADRQPQSIQLLDSALRAPMLAQASATLERQLPKNINVSVTYTHTSGSHQLRSRDINAPLPGTYTGPGTGVFPYGNPNPLLLYESSAVFRQDQLTANVNARVNSKFSLTGYFSSSHANSNSDGSGTFPANSYDLSTEWGRAGFDIHYRAQIGGTMTLPFKIEVAPNISMTTAPALNITTGTDLNGDTILTDRPAFATVPADPAEGVIATPWGIFNRDPVGHPQFGTVIVPRNYAHGFGNININGRIGRTWNFGERANAGAGQGSPRFSLNASVQAHNWINHVNPGRPIAILSSPFVGQTLDLQNGQSNANRRVEIDLRFNF
ncbi:MAG TPA: hypothetical protein VFW83_01025, partial [Bryobacteraceae bacterium]|nr:hypothetical protein [Bryobacteraceae bacterium]